MTANRKNTAVRRAAAALVLVLLLCVMAGWFCETAAAAGDLMEQKGIEGLFSRKSDDTGKGPTKVQTYIGLGSIVVMIAVVKYL